MLLRRVVEVFRGEEGADDSSDDSSQGITGGDGRFGADQSTRAAAGEATEEGPSRCSSEGVGFA